jgi:hypothetical protein
MEPAKGFAITNRFLIVPNCFINIEGEVTAAVIDKLSAQKIYWGYLWERLTPKYVLGKIKYRKSKKLFKKEYGFVPMKTVRLKLPGYKSPSLL